MPTWLCWTLVATNVVTFLLYGFDKLCAARKKRRVPEFTLLMWLFLGNPIGAWLGMQLFHHKTQKGSFRWRAVLLTLINPLWFVLVFWWSRP